MRCRTDDTLPGVTRVDAASKRATRPEIRAKALQFSPSGRAFAVACTEGLLVYSLDDSLVFDPYELGEVRACTARSPCHAPFACTHTLTRARARVPAAIMTQLVLRVPTRLTAGCDTRCRVGGN